MHIANTACRWGSKWSLADLWCAAPIWPRWWIVNFALTLSSALFLILIFPRFGWTWLAPVALAPLLVACAREMSWKKRFAYGWIAGAVFWASVCYWIQFVLEVHGGMGRWGGWSTFVLFALYK